MRELELRWSFRDMVEAHEMLDALEDADYRAHEAARREHESASRSNARQAR